MLRGAAERGRMNKEAAAAITDATDLAAQGIGLLASHGQAAQAAATLLRSRYRWADERDAELLVALGGDAASCRRRLIVLMT